MRNLENWVKSKATYFSTWSGLAIFGNNPIVKLTIIAPLLAQAIIHSTATIQFLTGINITLLYWLYFSLLSFSVAQLIYIWQCPRDIKDYPSGIKYTQALDATTQRCSAPVSSPYCWPLIGKKPGIARHKGVRIVVAHCMCPTTSESHAVSTGICSVSAMSFAGAFVAQAIMGASVDAAPHQHLCVFWAARSIWASSSR